jgi:hypothetical protein
MAANEDPIDAEEREIEAATPQQLLAPVKVLAIVGWGRSGSTILDNLLGELDGFFSGGEVHNLWRRGLLMGHTCGCGAPVAECEVWSRVLAEASIAGHDRARRVVEWQRDTARTRHVARLLAQREHSSRRPVLELYADTLGKLYRAIANITGDRVVVDSSKRPAHASILRLVSGIEPYVVHLVRDPRAVAYSRRRGKVGVDRDMRSYGVVHSTLGWLGRNLASEAVRRRYAPGRSMLVRYEDFVARPEQTLTAIAAHVGERITHTPVQDGQTALLGPNHAVAGNPSRFRTGRVELRQDTAWRTEQRRTDRVVATALATPLLHRYRYTLRTPHASMRPRAR